MAKLPAPNTNHYRVQDFSGGLNTNTDPSLLEDNEASDLLNVDFDSKGVIQKRSAVRIYERTNGDFSADCYTDVYDFYRTNLVKERIYFHESRHPSGVLSAGVTSRYIDPDTGLSTYANLRFVDEDGETDFDFNDSYLHKEEDLKWSFFTFYDKMYMMNAAFGLFVYNGYNGENPTLIQKMETGSKEDATDIDFAQPCRYAIVHKNRVFYAGYPEESDKYAWSEIGKPNNLKTFVADEGTTSQESAGGYGYLPSNDVEITGMGTFLEKLVFFKLNSAYVLSGSGNNDWQTDKINVNDGCISHHTIVQGNNYLYFLSPTGLNYLYSPDQQMIETSSLSDKIKDDLLEHDFKNSFALFYSGKYYLFVPNYLYIYDEELKCWTKHDVDMKGGLVDKINKEILMYTHRYSEKLNGYAFPCLYHFDRDFLNDEYLPDQETAIICRYQTRYFDFLEPELMKRLKFVKIFFLPTDDLGEIRLIQEINYRSQTRFVDTSYLSITWGQSIWGSSSWGAKVDFSSKKVPIGGQGEYVRYTFVNDKLDQEFKIFSFIIGYKRKQKVR